MISNLKEEKRNFLSKPSYILITQEHMACIRIRAYNDLYNI